MSQTLTYTIGSDRRALVDNIQDFKVDFGDDNQNWVQARQFERGMRQVFVNIINEDNTPFDLTGCNVWFEGLLPNTANGDFRVIDSDGYVPLDPSSGKFRFDMPGQAFTVAGSYRQAFFRIVKNGNSVTTLEFDLDVLADKVIDGLVPKDWIGPFETIADQLVDDLQKHTDAADKTIADFQQKVTDLVNQLNQQGTTTTSMLTELQNRITDLETKIKQDGLFTQAEADQFKQLLDGEIENLKGTVTASLNSQGLNVKNYGAVGDGVADDTKAIQTAISTAQSGDVKRVYFPAGKYLTTLTNQIISGISICGENRMTSTIISDTADPVFLVGTNSTIKSLGFHSNVATSNTMIGIGKSSPTDVAEWNITLEDLRFDSIEYPDPTKKTLGGWGLRPINFVLDNLGLWDVTVRNVSMQYVYSGLNIDTINGGWLTGSLFDNIVVKGFDHHAFGIISSNQTLQQVSQNVFSNLTAEVLYETHGDDASGFIVAGGGNEFDNLRLFNDGTYNEHALTLRFFGKDEKFKQFPSFAAGTTTSNTFSGGELEGYIYDPDNLKSFQSFSHLKTRVPPKIGSMQDVNVANETFENLLSKAGFLKNIVGDLQTSIPPDATMTTGLDKFGQFIDISFGNTDGSFDYIISDPAGTLNAIKDDAFSIGIRYRDMTESNTSALDGYIKFGSKDYSPTRVSFQNANRYSDIQERVWCCEPMTDDFSKITSFTGENRVVFYITAHSRIRIYRCMLVSGRTTDFSKVVENSISNTGSAGATPRLPSGTDLNYLVKNLIQFSGTYFVDNTNRPADTPKEFGNDSFIITVTPGSASNNGMISLMDPATNTMLIAGVNAGNAGAWITLHA